MSWYAKVLWSEGLFLRPQHLQQGDRYLEHLIESRVRHVTPYPWGFSALDIDRDLALQAKFALRHAAGLMPDGLPFDLPSDGALPPALDIPPDAANVTVWLSLPLAALGSCETEIGAGSGISRYVAGSERVIDSTSSVRLEEEIDLAHPRLAFDLRRAARPGFAALPLARILEVRDKTVVYDERFVPPLLVTAAHPVMEGWVDRVTGWIEAKLDELARYAADPTAGGGLQSADYFVLQVLNRHCPLLKHYRRSRFVHPERLFETLLQIAGELATFASPGRRAADYPAYDHDNLELCFAPVLRDIQDYLSAQFGRRAIRLDLIERAPNAFVSPIRDRNLFRNASFVLEVAARRPLSEIQTRFPNLLKVGPSTKMSEIVNAHLPGVGLTHLPTPPPLIRAVVDHVYFSLDRTSPLWPEFSTASSLGLHFSGDWPELQLELWAVPRDRA
ncbi:MAG TPA: type VI secretion system baseplate subunit TssK [Lichenihabitans sp.]|jgi:type VI secretion system protein ImpJ|nr:type VI secretion system baseplate subunit TssK [Lichenihabitans sp.]